MLSKVWLHLPLKHIMLFTVQQDNLTLVMVFEWVNRLIAMCNNRIIQLIRRKLNIPVNRSAQARTPSGPCTRSSPVGFSIVLCKPGKEAAEIFSQPCFVVSGFRL